MGWLKEKIKNHLEFTGGKLAPRVGRDYFNQKVTIDYLFGPTVTYDYDGNWISG